MAYATIDDAETFYGSEYIAAVCDRNADDSVDVESFQAHLDAAHEEMDGYLLGRYSLPLATPPGIFKRRCVDIAIYNAAARPPTLTQEMRDRYKQAIDYMHDIARNVIKLQTAPNTTALNKPHGAEVLTRQDQTGLVQLGARTFTRKSTRGIG